MARMSRKERRLQKKLIPLNIVLCIISLAAAVSMFFTPIITVDIGKILKEESVMSYVDKSMEDMVKNSGGESAEGIDVAPVVTSIVKNVFSTAEGQISVTAYGAYKVAFTSESDKATAVLDELFFGENALVTKLIDSIVDGVTSVFESPEGKALIEETIVNVIAKELAENIDGVTEQQIKDLTNTFKKIENIQDGDVSPVVNEFADKVEDIVGSEISAEDRENIAGVVQDMYDQTKEQLGDEDVTIESIICVLVSQSVDLGQFNIGDIIANINGGNGDGADTVAYVSVTDQTDGEASNDGGNDGEAERTIVKSYSELLTEIGLGDEEKAQLKADLRETIRTEINKSMGIGSDDTQSNQQAEQFAEYYSYVFYVSLAFVAPWLILFLFSLLHIFTKNKKVAMWYVKLLGLIPVILFVVFTFAPTLLPVIAPSLVAGEEGQMILAVLKGVSTSLWISTACYAVMWLVSIFWAHPIKRKIRKERKAFKYGSRFGEYEENY